MHEKQVAFSRWVAHLIDDLNVAGYEVTFGEAYRPPEMAEIYAKVGKGITNSLHWNRLAIDLCLFKNGTYLEKTEEYEPAGMIWESYGETGLIFCWGGRFVTRPDGNHFSLSHNGVR